MSVIIDLLTNPNFWFGVIRSTTPIVLTALAALLAARAGIINMSLEGTMLFSALFAVIASALTQSALIGVLVAIINGVLLSLFLAYFKLKMKADETLVGIALNLLATGATIFILYLFTGDKGTSSSLQSKTLAPLEIPILKDIPFVGDIISGHSIIVYIAIISVILVHYMLFKTPLGLRTRSVGGNRSAAESVGISVHRTQYIAMAISGIFVGLAGAYMSMSYMSMFTKNMTAGRGYIALAASNVGGRAPIGAMLASLVFGFFESVGNNLQQFAFPPEFIYMIPYVATIIMYAVSSYLRVTQKKRRKASLAKLEAKEG